MRRDENQLMRTVEMALESHGLAVRLEARFVEDAPAVTDIWLDGDDEEWPEVLVSYLRGAEDVRIIIGGFTFESVPYDATSLFIERIFLGEYEFTESKTLFGRRDSFVVQVVGQKYSASQKLRQGETRDPWEDAALRRTLGAGK